MPCILAEGRHTPKTHCWYVKYEDDLTKLYDEISNRILTKRDLSEIEEELSKAVDAKKLQVSH